jgi:hypothetical protein
MVTDVVRLSSLLEPTEILHSKAGLHDLYDTGLYTTKPSNNSHSHEAGAKAAPHRHGGEAQEWTEMIVKTIPQ